VRFTVYNNVYIFTLLYVIRLLFAIVIHIGEAYVYAQKYWFLIANITIL